MYADLPFNGRLCGRFHLCRYRTCTDVMIGYYLTLSRIIGYG